MEHHHQIRNILIYIVLLHGAPPSDKKHTDLHCTLHGATPSDKKHTDLHCTTTWSNTIR